MKAERVGAGCQRGVGRTNRQLLTSRDSSELEADIRALAPVRQRTTSPDRDRQRKG